MFTTSQCIYASLNLLPFVPVDKHEYVLIANNVVKRNGRHGINIVTGSKHVSVIDNLIDYNGFEDEGCGVCFGNNFGFDTRGGKDILCLYYVHLEISYVNNIKMIKKMRFSYVNYFVFSYPHSSI